MGTQEPFETDETSAAELRAKAAANANDRPDWLVGADEGVEGELARQLRERAADAPAPVLRRPEAPADPSAPTPTREAPRLRLVGPSAPAPAAPAAPAKPEAWKAAASSLPTLRVVAGTAPAPAKPAPAKPAREEPLDDEPRTEFPDDGVEAVPAPSASTAPRIAAPHEPWWVLALESLRSDRRVQVGVLVAVALLCAYLFWPRGESSVGLGTIRRHPQVWDGRQVRVSGRVGDVFQVGGGYAFYLIQGRDTLVVFTRSRTPHPREKITLNGSISTGYLDGAPRQSLFEVAR